MALKHPNYSNHPNINAPDGPATLRQVAHLMLDRIPLGVVLFDNELRILDCNDPAKELLNGATHLGEALQRGCSADFEGDWQNDLASALQDSEPRIFESFIYASDTQCFTLQAICSPIRRDSEPGDLLGGVLLLEDITAKQAMHRELASAERLAAVGKLAARVAHELNNPLDGILRYINLALRVVEKENAPQAVGYLNESRKGLMRMVRIISELLQFSRSTFSSFEEADINKLVEDAVKSMESQAARNQVQVNRHYSPAMPNIRSGNLVQVFSNLIKNAIDAMPDGGTLNITTGCDDHHARIALADTGPGIPREIRKHVFEPFFTTKEQGKGTGLGLAICKDIIERYDGTIEVTDHDGGGSVFTASIPLHNTSRPSGTTRTKDGN